MSWWRRSSGGRHARAVPARGAMSAVSRLTVEPAQIVVPPSPGPEPWGAVRLVFDDGSAVALDAHDPRSRAFRAIADGILERPAATAQGRPAAADPVEDSDGGAAPDGSLPGERGPG